MIEKPFRIAHLMTLFLQDRLSSAEKVEFEAWLAEDKKNIELLQEFKNSSAINDDLTFINSLDPDEAWQKMTKKVNPVKYLTWLKVAAIFLVLFGGIIWFVKRETIDNRTAAIIQKKGDHIFPAQSSAILVLSNGTNFQLNAKKKTDLGKDLKLTDKELLYTNTINASKKLEYNTLVVPKASFFRVTLSDGTKVWVNAMSQLRFPIQFGDKERRVQLIGEAYFEVAKDSNRPFYVDYNNASTKVLGTHFNVNAYSNTARTTLVEGKVEVNNGKETIPLKPGQFANISNTNISTGTANIQRDLSWKQNEFYFKGDNIVSISSQLSRWYNVEIKLKGNVPLDQEFNGIIQRDVKLSEVLEMLEYVGNLHFTLDGRQLTIEKKP